ncbi:MAG TPA: ATP-binding protein, partial [Roseiflexaceae bacterium]|nr:ATP-binding protein [Roseiflexaceae bacterium]
GLSLYDDGELEIVAGINLSRPMGRRIPLDSTNPAVRVFKQNRTIIIDDLHQEPDFHSWNPNPIIHAWIGTPLRIGNLVIGMLGVDSHRVGTYTTQDIGVLEAFANQAAIAIENTRLFSQARLAWYAAEAASRAKSEFLSNISHELRTPLNGVLGYAQVLQRDAHLSDNQNTALHIIQRSGEHLLALLNDILDLGAVEANRLALTISAIDLQDFLYVVLGMVRTRAEEKNLALTFTASPDIPGVITSDEKRLRQVLLNLLGNAIKFTNQGSVALRVSALPSRSGMRQMIRFEVADTGSGIDPADLDRIFEPFEQGHADRKIDGVGLGLPISRRLLALMDSELHVESTLGQGSRFWFDLPVSVTANPILLPNQRVTGYAGRRCTILAIDDQPVNCAVLADMLTPLGFTVHTATSACEGLARARDIRPDCVLTDLAMPDMKGDNLADAIHATPGLEHCVVIAVTARITDREHLPYNGYADLVSKPINEAVLLTTLARHLKIKLEFEALPAGEKPAHSDTPLPMEQLAPLIHLARRGDMFALADAAAALAHNPEHEAFARHIEQLARDYHDAQVLDVLLQAGKP